MLEPADEFAVQPSGEFAPESTTEPAAPPRVRAVSAEGEAEAEVESEAEAEAAPGSASAVAGTSVAVSAAGVSAFLSRGGRTFAVAAETLTAVDAASSTSTALSAVAGRRLGDRPARAGASVARRGTSGCRRNGTRAAAVVRETLSAN